MTARVTSRHYKIYIKGKLYKTCKSEQEKNRVMARLKQDKSLKQSDITIGLSLLVSA